MYTKTPCSLADAGRNAEVRSYGIIGGSLDDLDRLVKKLVATGKEMHFVCEAGACGYDVFRSLTEKGFDCAVCSPANVPKSPSDRIKTDPRDAITLARLHRAGEFTYVFVPRPDVEAMRDLTRCREDAKMNPASDAAATGRHATSSRFQVSKGQLYESIYLTGPLTRRCPRIRNKSFFRNTSMSLRKQPTVLSV